jgi:microcompartment protein CcmK/EutM
VQIAHVLGEVVATVKSEALTGHKLLVLQPVTPDRTPAGRTVVATDAVGAGVGEYVFFVRGREASFPFLPAETPVDACIVGIVDHWDLEDGGVGSPAGPSARGV